MMTRKRGRWKITTLRRKEGVVTTITNRLGINKQENEEKRPPTS